MTQLPKPGHTQTPTTVGFEATFERYLGQRLLYTYEPLIGEKRPDFLVADSVVCEITEITAGHLPRNVSSADPGRNVGSADRGRNVGSADPVRPITMKIRRKWAQAEASALAGYPFVLVLCQQGHQTDLSSHTIAEACFGQTVIPMTFDAVSGAMNAGAAGFSGDGKTEPDGNKNLSAIAILREFNPTLLAWQLEVRRRKLELPQETVKMAMEQTFEIGQEVSDELIAKGTFDPEALAQRLVVVHTRSPTYALSPGLLGGPYDEEWAFGDSGSLERVHVGESFEDVPS